MPASTFFHALNIGVVDRDKLHRVDLERMRLAAEEQTNLLCDAVGKAFLRPGFKSVGQAPGGADPIRLIPFDAGAEQVYALELGDHYMRIWDDGVLVARPAVTTTIPNGDMSSSVGWTLGTDAGTTVAIGVGQTLALRANGRGARAYARRLVTVSGANIGVEHGLAIDINRGPVRFRVGSTVGGEEYIAETILRTGFHSLAIVPTGNFYIEFSSHTPYNVVVDSIEVEPGGAGLGVYLTTPWATADLPLIRFDQSLDVMFVACEGKKQQRIESRGDNSWSVVDYESDDGPFLVGRPAEIKIKPSVLEGNGTLTSDAPFFTPDHVGSLVRIYHDGQKILTSLAAEGAYTPPILVTGINEPSYNERFFTYTITGTWVGTLQWERSFDGEDVEFRPFRKAQGTADIPITTNVADIINDDNDDNAIAYYRLGFPAGSYTSGAATVSVTYTGGGGYGIARIVDYDSSTVVQMVVLNPFSDTSYSDQWRIGAWSDAVGYPSAVALDDGRLSWSGYGSFWGSVSDAYDSFDEEMIGDAGPLLRSIAVGGRNEARWMLSLSKLMVGTNRLIAEVRASSLDEVKTPDNFGIKRTGGRIGAARVNPALLSDDRALFVESGGDAIFEINFDGSKGRFLSTEFSKLTTDLFASGITGMAVQNRPDQRIWVTTNSGEAVCIVFQPEQEVVAFIPIVTGGDEDFIESIVVLAAESGQDRVMASIQRPGPPGFTTRSLEVLAIDDHAMPLPSGGESCKTLDCFVEFGLGDTSVQMPTHLEGRMVWVWRDAVGYEEDEDGVPIEYEVPAGGLLTIEAGAYGIAGLPYSGRYKSAKLEYGSGTSSSVLTNKVVSRIGLLMADYLRSGIKYGTEFDNADHPLFDLPSLRNGMPVVDDIVSGPDVHEPMFPTSGAIGLDTRMCIEVTKPAAILALVMEFEGHG